MEWIKVERIRDTITHKFYIYIYIYIPWRDFSQASSVKQKLPHNKKSKKKKRNAKCILPQSTSKYTKKRQLHLEDSAKLKLAHPNERTKCILSQVTSKCANRHQMCLNSQVVLASIIFFLRINDRCWPS